VRGADVPVRGSAHLTLPSLSDGPLPLPPEALKGGEGLVSEWKCGQPCRRAGGKDRGKVGRESW
jgi:hypothetical protein